MASSGAKDDSWEYSLRKYLLLLATLVATVTYSAAFNPPGGVWQDSDPAENLIAGDPIILNTNHARYLAFFYGNATAFASSLVVIVLVLILSLLHDRGVRSPAPVRILRVVMVLDLVSLMVAYGAGTFRDVLTAVYSLLLLAGVVAYLVVHLVLASLPETVTEETKARPDDSALLRLRKVLMLLATFAVSVTYLSGLSAPGGFWGDGEGGHKPGSAVLKGGPHDKRLKAFFVCNTTAFVASLLILVMLLEKKLCFGQTVRSLELYGLIAVTLAGLVAAYAAGSGRKIDTTIYVTALVGAVAMCILVQVGFFLYFKAQRTRNDNGSSEEQQRNQVLRSSVKLKVSMVMAGTNRAHFSAWSSATHQHCIMRELMNYVSHLLLTGLFSLLFTSDELRQQTEGPQTHNGNASHEQQQQTEDPQTRNGNGSDDEHAEQQNQALEKARSLVLLLATLAAAITYQAGLNPPGALWQDDGDGYKAGDPILLTENPRRYKAFYYCNSTAFVASLVAIILARMNTLHHHNALEVAMVLDLFGLIGAYATGSCRDVSTSIYAVSLAGAVLVYVVIHVVLFTLDPKDGSSNRRGSDEASIRKEKEAEKLMEKRRKRLLLFAILAATITYQAGLTPPGGFLDSDDTSGHHAGDPVLLSNYPRRYTAFFYCNSVSFMLSIALIIILVNPNLYRPAIQSNALSVCTAAGMVGILGGYAAGSTQHIKTSIYIFALAAVVLCSVALLVALFIVLHRLRKQEERRHNPAGNSSRHIGVENIEIATGALQQHPAPVSGQARRDKKLHAKRKYLMLLGILAASVTYQAGLAPPGGFWQSNDGGHIAGSPVMHDNWRPRYLAFFYSNSTSFVASVVVIVLLLPPSLHEKPWWLWVMNITIVLDLLGLLIAYAAGSSRRWKTSVIVSALVIAVLAYFAVHVLLSYFVRRGKKTAPAASAPDTSEVGNGEHQAQMAPGLELTEAI
ncbi:hypothetical protein HU200_053621 [Digitaria exilis]|uniref:PGG domain-containing protein n=1 Tax=Digitaria exilis TaxID=1010633 RepID=A0A835AMQ8_9POAL|nr:hypothetical protein HU200_053621 [Digitaria exilis]